MAGKGAEQIVGSRIAPLLRGRSGTPRFVQHALMTTNVRLAMMERGATAWRFEQQMRTRFRYGGKDYDVRPDGVAIKDSGLIAIEVDLGHLAPRKFGEKLAGYQTLITSGVCQQTWGVQTIKVLVVTTGRHRAASLKRQLPRAATYDFRSQTFEELGLAPVGGWS